MRCRPGLQCGVFLPQLCTPSMHVDACTQGRCTCKDIALHFLVLSAGAGAEEDDDAQPSTSGRAEEDGDAQPSTSGRGGGDRRDPSGGPAPLHPSLVTLALLPRSQWQGLVHLDAIKVGEKCGSGSRAMQADASGASHGSAALERLPL